MIEPKFKHDPRGSTWIEHAACIGEDPELFFPVGTTGTAIDQTRRAKAVCSDCSVRGACLRWSLDTCQDAGVWGGLDEEERRVLRRQRRREAAEREAAARRLSDDRRALEVGLASIAG